MRASLTVLTTVLLAIVTLGVSGCGLKGDLYLPADEAVVPSAEPDESREEPADRTED